MVKPSSCCTLAEIANLREKFVWNGPPYFVVDKTEWIMWSACIHRSRYLSRAYLVDSRYLLVRVATEGTPHGVEVLPTEEPKVGKYLKQEQNLSTSLGAVAVDIPQPSYQLDKLVRTCVFARKDIVFEAEDCAIFDGPKEVRPSSEVSASSSKEVIATTGTEKVSTVPCKAWTPNEEWIQRNATDLLPPPTKSSITASVALQREFRSIMREQTAAQERNDLGTLGWYLPPQHNENNLYQWLVELHSFDPELPVAKDMKTK